MNLPPLIKEIARVIRHPVQYLLLRGVYNRIRRIEYRSFNRRYFAVEQVAEYLIGAQIPGDYCEFGVWQGATFSHACRAMAPHFKDMRFLAFDSFQGLPRPGGIDAAGGYTSHFYEGQFAATREQFLGNVGREGADLRRVVAVEGWFNETLAPARAAAHGVDRIAVAWIDCDLYESTVPVLDYLASRVSVGTVLAFDDWHCYRNHPDFGQQRAMREWLARNPQIALNELFSFGWNGMVFTVGSC
jgi:O-methyltransferase